MAITEMQIKTWLNAPASGSGVYQRDWDQLCQALMWRLIDAFGTPATPDEYASARTARLASTIVSTIAAAAPAGAFHWYDIGTYGHVSVSLGGSRTLMASRHVSERWALNAGVTTVEAYVKATGARYLGWSHTNGARNDVEITPSTAPASSVSSDNVKLIARFLNSLKLGRTTTADVDGAPGEKFYWLAQTWGSKNGHYPQPAYLIDGKTGARTEAIIAGALLAAAKAWETPPTPPLPAYVAPTEAQYKALMAELGAARTTIVKLNAEVATLGKKIEAGRLALA